MKKWMAAAAAAFLGLLTLCLYVRCLLWRPLAVTAATFGILGGLALWEYRVRLMLRFAPCLLAKRRLDRFLRSGKKVRVVCFGDTEAGEEPGFHLAFDGIPRRDSGLTALMFSSIEPESLGRHTAAFHGKTAEAYCYLDAWTGVQLTGTLETGEDGFRLSVRGVKNSGAKRK